MTAHDAARNAAANIAYPDPDPDPEPPAWWRYAACRDSDPDLFFPPRSTTAKRLEAQAKAICNACPVRNTCLEEALTNHEKHGIFGGTTPRERTRIMKARQR